MPNKPNKTKPTALSAVEFLGGVEPEARRVDALVLLELLTRVSGEPARMWGPSIVGFGVRQYRYESGREGEILKVGFALRKSALTLYVCQSPGTEPLAQRLGTFTHGKGCIYVKRLADIDLGVLEALVAKTCAEE